MNTCRKMTAFAFEAVNFASQIIDFGPETINSTTGISDFGCKLINCELEKIKSGVHMIIVATPMTNCVLRTIFSRPEIIISTAQIIIDAIVAVFADTI